MPRLVLTIVFFIHGFIHVIGFAKGFALFDTPTLSQEVSRFNGSLWLLATVLLPATGVLFIQRNNKWWIAAIACILLSQYLIFTTWHESKIGTLANALILLAAIAGFGEWNFKRLFLAQVQEGKIQDTIADHSPLIETDLKELPPIVKKYILSTGAVNNKKVSSFKVNMEGRIRKTAQSEWMSFSSEQYNFTGNPTRLFWMKANMLMLPVTGFHCFKSEKTFMDIRLFSMFQVEYQSGKEMEIAETVTYFNDLCIFAPGGLIDKRISWKEVDPNKIQASFSHKDITITAILYFNEQGELINFVSEDRYFNAENNTMKKVAWSTPVKSYREKNGYKIPYEADAVWKFEEGDLCYGKFKIKDIEFHDNRIVR